MESRRSGRRILFVFACRRLRCVLCLKVNAPTPSTSSFNMGRSDKMHRRLLILNTWCEQRLPTFIQGPTLKWNWKTLEVILVNVGLVNFRFRRLLLKIYLHLDLFKLTFTTYLVNITWMPSSILYRSEVNIENLKYFLIYYCQGDILFYIKVRFNSVLNYL